MSGSAANERAAILQHLIRVRKTRGHLLHIVRFNALQYPGSPVSPLPIERKDPVIPSVIVRIENPQLEERSRQTATAVDLAIL